MARRAGTGRGNNQRQRRVGEELRHALAHILQRGELRDSDLVDQSITVTEIRVGHDLRNATVFIMPLGGEGGDRVVAALGRATPFLRSCIAKEVRLRIVPELTFRLDDSFANAARIDDLLASSPAAPVDYSPESPEPDGELPDPPEPDGELPDPPEPDGELPDPPEPEEENGA